MILETSFNSRRNLAQALWSSSCRRGSPPARSSRVLKQCSRLSRRIAWIGPSGLWSQAEFEYTSAKTSIFSPIVFSVCLQNEAAPLSGVVPRYIENVNKDDVKSRGEIPVHQHPLGDDPVDLDVLAMSPGERLALVWPLTVQAWTFAGQFNPEERLQRNIVR